MRVVLTLLAVLLPCEGWAQPSEPYRIVFDSYMTPAAGAQDLLTLQRALTVVEDRWLPLGGTSGRARLALGILYRSTKLIALDVPQDHFLMVVAHEVFGHGARFRELGDGRIRYGFDAPIPYGDGGAVTKFRGRFPASPLASLNVSAAGMEAQHALADAVAERAVSRGRLHYREGWLYFESRLAALDYIQSASPHSADGHDVADFLATFEEACTAPCTPPSRSQVKDRALVMLADPMLYYAAYAFAAAYIAGGNTTGPVPMLRVSSTTRVLPSIGFALAPYGTEWTLRAAIARTSHPPVDSQGARRLSSITMRIGSTGASTTMGIGARVKSAARLRGIPLDAAVDIWRQPDLLAEHTSDRLGGGAGASVSAILPLPRSLRTRAVDALSITTGYKSRGYIPGEPLSRGGFLRAGIAVSLP